MIGFLLNFPKFLENTWARISEDTDLYFFLRTHTHTSYCRDFEHFISYHIISSFIYVPKIRTGLQIQVDMETVKYV